jgi:hypothetical protein
MKVFLLVTRILLSAYLLFSAWIGAGMVYPSFRLKLLFVYLSLILLMWNAGKLGKQSLWRLSMVIMTFLFLAGLCWGIARVLPIS